MPPEGSRLRCQSEPSDILSNLPENVIDEILVCLRLRDAVRTSILSKTWRYKWSRLPQLTLDQTLWETTRHLVSPAIKFTNIMYHLLTLHEGPITKFTLSIPRLWNCPKFDNLIYFLSKNGIEDFVLQLSEGRRRYNLPSSLFTCLQMRHLALRNCSINPPPAFKGFDSLISLELCEITITSKWLESIISHCPLLEHLALHLAIVDHVQINAPKLRSFNFTGGMMSLSVGDVPLLAKLSFSMTYDAPVELPNWVLCSMKYGIRSMAKFFEPSSSLECLHLNYRAVQFLVVGVDEVPTSRPFTLNCLKHLYLSDICLHELRELSATLYLIKSSPYLQDMEIKVNNWPDRYFTVDSAKGHAVSDEIVNWLRAPGCLRAIKLEGISEGFSDVAFSDMTANHLRSVKLNGIVGTNFEMQFIKLLLAKSPVLVRMIVQSEPEDNSPEVLAELTKFHRESPQAEVIYNVDFNPV